MSDFQLVRIKKVASMMDESISNVRARLTKRRKGEGDFPMPISGHKERLAWLRSEVESYIFRRNTAANGAPLQNAQQLSPESMMLADRLGLDNPMQQDNSRKKGGRKQ